MVNCDGCLWSDQCRTGKNTCMDFTPLDCYEGLDDTIEEERFEFRRFWFAYMRESERKAPTGLDVRH